MFYVIILRPSVEVRTYFWLIPRAENHIRHAPQTFHQTKSTIKVNESITDFLLFAALTNVATGIESTVDLFNPPFVAEPVDLGAIIITH